MEPKKARLAIALTIIVALIIIGACLCLLLDFNPMDVFAEEEPTPEPTATPAPVVEVKPVPGPADLKGCSDELYMPKAENYLNEYVPMITHSSESEKVYVQYRPEKREYSRDVIVELDNNSVVTAIAKENGYTLVLVQDGVAGWVITHELDAY